MDPSTSYMGAQSSYPPAGESKAPLYTNKSGGPPREETARTSFIHSKAPTNASVSKTRLALNKATRWIRLITLLSTLFSMILSAIMEGAMIYMLYTYLRSHNKRAYEPFARDDDDDPDEIEINPWPNNPKLWPTYLLLVSSSLTLVGSLVILVVTCCRYRHKKAFSLVYHIIHVIFWIAIAITYRMGKSQTDLWGWSCDKAGGPWQEEFQGLLEYGTMCKVQTGSWTSSIIEASIKLTFTGFGWYLKTRQSRLRVKFTKEFGKFAAEGLDF